MNKDSDAFENRNLITIQDTNIDFKGDMIIEF